MFSLVEDIVVFLHIESVSVLDFLEVDGELHRSLGLVGEHAFLVELAVVHEEVSDPASEVLVRIDEADS